MCIRDSYPSCRRPGARYLRMSRHSRSGAGPAPSCRSFLASCVGRRSRGPGGGAVPRRPRSSKACCGRGWAWRRFLAARRASTLLRWWIEVAGAAGCGSLPAPAPRFDSAALPWAAVTCDRFCAVSPQRIVPEVCSGLARVVDPSSRHLPNSTFRAWLSTCAALRAAYATAEAHQLSVSRAHVQRDQHSQSAKQRRATLCR